MFHIEKKLWRLVEPLLVNLVSSELGPDPMTGGGLFDQRDLHGLIRVFKGWQLESVEITFLKSSDFIMTTYWRCGRGLQMRFASVMSSPSSLVALQKYIKV